MTKARTSSAPSANRLALTRFLQGHLFGVSPLDPATFLFAGASTLVIIVMTSLIPAWRATRVDPVATLRHQGR